MGQQMMELEDGSAMWKCLCERIEGTANKQTRAMTNRQLYTQLEAARCKQNGSVKNHLNYMCRLHTRLKTVGMTLDDAVLSGMLVSSLPTSEQFDRLRGYVDTGMSCVDTPDKVVAMAITFDKANRADSQLQRAFGSRFNESATGQTHEEQRHTIRTGRSEPKSAPAVSSTGTPDDISCNGTSSHRGSTQKKPKGTYRPEAWVFDCGANRHLVGDKRYFVEYRSLSGAEKKKETVQCYNGTSAPVGVATIDLWVVVNGGHVALRLEQVYYYSPKRSNLFSQSVARQQGFKIDYDDSTAVYTPSKNEATALQAPLKSKCGLWMFTGHNEFVPGERDPRVPEDMVNFALRDGFADLQCCHERLGHLNPQYIRKMDWSKA
ncbi:hypothetical protein PR001_g1119 [Phytophthora rubi]|uniref:Retrovirus-related Pol polyprotein from transposon TNT 1-94-like beta-barrel domain-containing protein n=1 Tax=Phytophthora rubi TaxID=129364 RepID=A0A6A3P7Y0_9STRA|nr:hypothetical protein PR001_g1119 [Phytophthora rubi]